MKHAYGPSSFTCGAEECSGVSVVFNYIIISCFIVEVINILGNNSDEVSQFFEFGEGVMCGVRFGF